MCLSRATLSQRDDYMANRLCTASLGRGFSRREEIFILHENVVRNYFNLPLVVFLHYI